MPSPRSFATPVLLVGVGRLGERLTSVEAGTALAACGGP
jgi:hypothetical protein